MYTPIIVSGFVYVTIDLSRCHFASAKNLYLVDIGGSKDGRFGYSYRELGTSANCAYFYGIPVF